MIKHFYPIPVPKQSHAESMCRLERPAFTAIQLLLVHLFPVFLTLILGVLFYRSAIPDVTFCYVAGACVHHFFVRLRLRLSHRQLHDIIPT